MLKRVSTSFRKKSKSEGQSNGDSSELDRSTTSQDVSSTFEQYGQLIHGSRRPLPAQTGDGSYIKHGVPTGFFEDLKNLGFKDVNTLVGVMRSRLSGEPMDDKTYLMERTIQLVSNLPAESQHRVDLTNAFIDELWSSLSHPSLSCLGDRFTFRQADGSGNA